MRIAVYGDIHGRWLEFAKSAAALADRGVSLVLQCGDAQPVRGPDDLKGMSCPEKYREEGSFSAFHRGVEVFPVPVLFIGGNHEPWGYLDQHPVGGVLAPCIEFLGRSGIREVGGLRVAGLSGVHSPRNYHEPHPRPPWPPGMARQASYYNEDDVKAVMAHDKVDVLLLHEWPSLMESARSQSWPARWKSKVGCDHLSRLVEAIRPRWVFCGHMHYQERLKVGRTEIFCLSDFSRSPSGSWIVLDI